MRLDSISTPEVYKESADFRFFLKWFEIALDRIRYDTENMADLYDPLRCPEHLLWLLCDTMGYKYDDRLPTAFNRLALIYFMSIIRNRGSKDGLILAAEVNAAQFDILEYGKENNELYNRLENDSIPVNSASVTPHTEEGYIEVVYFSSQNPIDAMLEYARPLGMYIFQTEGVRYDARTKISVDARLTNDADIGTSITPTHVGHYSREDYARMQKAYREQEQAGDWGHVRNRVWYRNADYEKEPNLDIDPGVRALNSLQLCNNEHVVQSLIQPIFSLGYHPQKAGETLAEDEDAKLYGKSIEINGVSVYEPQSYLNPPYQRNKPNWNLIYDKILDESLSPDFGMVDDARTKDNVNPRPAVNPVMSTLGDAISCDSLNRSYYMSNPDGTRRVVNVEDGQLVEAEDTDTN